MKKCPVCSSELTGFKDGLTEHSYYIECIQCGKFELTKNALPLIQEITRDDAIRRNLLSYGIRQKQKGTERAVVCRKDVKRILEEGFPGIDEQLRNILLLIRDNVIAPGQLFLINSKKDLSIIGAQSPQALLSLIKKLITDNMIDGSFSNENEPDFSGRFAFTVDGWDKYYPFIVSRSKLKRAYMAMDFKNAKIERVFSEIYKPLCEKYGFDLDIVSKKAGIVDIRMKEEIVGSEFVIADLTDDNNGSYWEAGIAEGLGIPVIYACEQSKFDQVSTHFDTSHFTTAKWNLDDKEFTRSNLKEILDATFPDYKPI